jgi:hybrid cluster-associated redox disulfide protein
MKLDKDMTIGEVVRTYPETIEVLMEFGMGCVGCPASQAETLEQAAMVHGFDVDELLEKLNEVV